MFSRANKNSGGQGRATAPSIISSDARFNGDVVSQGELHIDGHVEGDVCCLNLVIGQSGNIVGEIVAETVKVHGVVTGQIKAHSVILASTARMTGDIVHVSLSIETGAHVEGRLVRMEESVGQPRPANAQVSAEPELAGQLPAPAE